MIKYLLLLFFIMIILLNVKSKMGQYYLLTNIVLLGTIIHIFRANSDLFMVKNEVSTVSCVGNSYRYDGLIFCSG